MGNEFIMYLNFSQEFESAKSKINEMRINKIIENIMRFNKYLKYKREQGFTDNESIQEIQEDCIEVMAVLVNNSGTELMQREFYTLGILINNPYLLKEIYTRVKDDDLNNFDSNKEQYENNREENIWREFIVKLNIKFLRSSMMRYHKEDELNILVEYMKYRREETEKELKKRYINLLENVGKFASKYNFLEERLNAYNDSLRKISLHDLRYPLHNADKKNSKDLSLEELFSPSYLQNLSIEQLAILNLFWQNAFTKDIDSIVNGMFIKKNMQSSQNGSEMRKEDLCQSIIKREICRNVYRKISNSVERDGTVKQYQLEQNADFVDKYNRYFNDKFSITNTRFGSDMREVGLYENLQINAYRVKTDMLKMLLQTSLRKDFVTNAGIIEEKNAKDKFVLWGIDFPGMNIPVKLHVHKKDIEDFYYYINGNSILPIYRGNRDFIYQFRNISTTVLIPLTKDREKLIIKKSVDVVPVDVKYLLYKHLSNLVSTKTKKITRIYPEEYINLQTGEKGVMHNGEFQPKGNPENDRDTPFCSLS